MRDDRVYLLHIRDAINRVLDYTSDGHDFFFADTKTQDAVVRNIEIIGEGDQASERCSEGCSSRHPVEANRRHTGHADPSLFRRQVGPRVGSG